MLMWESYLDTAAEFVRLAGWVLDLGAEIPEQASRGQQALANLVKSEIARWAPIIKAANVNAE